MARELPPGLIFEMALTAGIELTKTEGKVPILCPFHEDQTASAFVSERNVFYCSVCTPDGGWSAKRFARERGLPWPFTPRLDLRRADWVRPRIGPPKPSTEPRFRRDEAELIWSWTRTCAVSDAGMLSGDPAHAYLARRGLSAALELGVVGVVGRGACPHPVLARWRYGGYLVVAPLFLTSGELLNVQARRVFDGDPKTLVPAGSQLAGTMFADLRAQGLLRGDLQDDHVVVVGEGLTDMLALAITSPVPVITVPGGGNAARCFGPWVAGRRVLLALDVDAAGQRSERPAARSVYEHRGASVRRLVWPHGCKDACELLKQRGARALREFLLDQVSEVSRGS